MAKNSNRKGEAKQPRGLYKKYSEITPFVNAYSQVLKDSRRKPDREYEHVNSLFHDLQESPQLREALIDELGGLQALIEDRVKIQTNLSQMVKEMPDLKDKVDRFKNQLDLLAQIELNENNLTKANIQILKFVSVELKKSSKQIDKQIEGMEFERTSSFIPFKQLRKQIITTFDEHIFKEGIENYNKHLEKYVGKNNAPGVSEAQAQQVTIQDQNEIVKQQRDFIQLYQWIVESNPLSERYLDRAHQQQIAKEAQEGHNIMQELGRFTRNDVGEPQKAKLRQQREQQKQQRRQERKQRTYWFNELRRRENQKFDAYVTKSLQVLVVDNSDVLVQEAMNYFQGIEIGKGFYDIVPHEFMELLTDSQIDQVVKAYKHLVKTIQRRRQIAETFKCINKYLSIGDQLVRAVLSLGKATQVVGKQAQQLFSDLSSPLSQIQGVLNMQVQGISSANIVFPTLIDIATEPLGTFLDVYGQDKNKTATKRSRKKNDNLQSQTSQQIGNIQSFIMNLASTIFKVVQQGFQITQMAISQGLELFVSVLQFHIKLLKELVKTSKVMGQIMNIFSLQITMFFMPFMNVFGDQLLTKIFDILLWQQSFNTILESEQFLRIIQAQQYVIDCFQKELVTLEEIQTKFIDEFLPAMMLMMGKVMIFVGYFVDALLKNYKSQLEPMLKEGIKAQNQLIKNNIIKIFIRFGLAVANFLDKNQIPIKNQLETAGEFLEFILDGITFVMKHMGLFAQGLGAQIQVQIATACVASYIGGTAMLPILMSLIGLKSVIIFDALQQGVGAIIGYAIYDLFFNDNVPELAKGGYIPAVPGGMFVIVAEKETEYIIPESKVHMIRGHNNLVIDVSGDVFGIDNPQAQIADMINVESNYSRFR